MASGWITDRFFGSRRNAMALVYGLVETAALVAFYLVPAGHGQLDVCVLVVYGFSMGGLLVFLGGLMAIDICSQRAAGAAMGLVGMMSYLGAAAQDAISGSLLEAGKTTLNGATVHSFDQVFLFWAGASVLSLVLTLSLWRARRG
jgi:OPA family sugar phosphate sensor protein UhpC-like MFS transporter